MKEEVKQEKESLEKLTDDIKSLEKKLKTSRDERDKVGLASEQVKDLMSIIRTDQQSLEDLRQRKDQATHNFETKKEELKKLLQKQSEGVGNIENPIADSGEEKGNEGGSIHSNNGAYIRPRVRRYSFKVNKKKKINKQKKKRPKHKHSFRLKKKTNNSSKKRNNTK